MNKSLKITSIAFIFIVVSGVLTYAFSGDPIAAVKQKVNQLSGLNLPTHSFQLLAIGPYQKVNIKFQPSNNKNISATYTSWFGLSPQMKCYSESANMVCS